MRDSPGLFETVYVPLRISYPPIVNTSHVEWSSSAPGRCRRHPPGKRADTAGLARWPIPYPAAVSSKPVGSRQWRSSRNQWTRPASGRCLLPSSRSSTEKSSRRSSAPARRPPACSKVNPRPQTRCNTASCRPTIPLLHASIARHLHGLTTPRRHLPNLRACARAGREVDPAPVATNWSRCGAARHLPDLSAVGADGVFHSIHEHTLAGRQSPSEENLKRKLNVPRRVGLAANHAELPRGQSHVGTAKNNLVEHVERLGSELHGDALL